VPKGNSTTWVFERRGKKQKAVGAYVPGQILKSRKHDEFEILSREGGQNTKNQPKYDEKQKPVKVEFKLIELTGSHIKNYFEALEWKTLIEHITACSKRSAQSSLSLQLKKALNDFSNIRENSLFLLNLEDSNSRGLTGPEGDDESVEINNFFNLCKADFFTPDKAKSQRGGSYGVGKSIFWKCSKVSTVLFSSVLDKDAKNKTRDGLRIFGRTELASHKIKEKSYIGQGFFGKFTENTEEGYKYDSADSIWNNNFLAERLYLNRDKKKGTGATVSIVGFNEELSKSGFEGHEILLGIKEKFEKYFWPSLALNPKTFEISFVYQRNSKIRNEYQDQLNVNLEKWEPFINAANVKKEKIVKIANSPGLVSKKTFFIKIPPRKVEITELGEKVKGDTKTNVEISIKREEKNMVSHEEHNKIALVRGFGMVVDYVSPKKEPLSSDLPYFGVVKVGKLMGESKADIISEIFFKDTEPALHDRWDEKTEGLRIKYSGYNDTIKDFYAQIDESLVEMCGEEDAESDKGPLILSDMLNLGFKSKPNETVISSEDIVAQATDKHKWMVSGKLKISDYPKSEEKKNDKSWNVTFGFSIKEETSRGDKVPFSKIEFLDEGVEIVKNQESVSIKATNTKSFAFKGELDLSSKIKNQNPKLCAVNFYTS